ncbi:MAG: transcription-repair coupling factor [Clostridia bacterium]|nr:transcription-repair coupling factor [Clostridia bacterium]
METFAKVLPKIKKFEEYINDVKKSNFPISLAGLTDSQKAHFVYATKFYTNRPVLFVTYNDIELKKMQNNIAFFDDEDVLTFPKKEIIYYDIDTMNKDTTMERLNVYAKLYNSEESLILTTVEALMQKTIPKTEMFSHVLHIEVGKELTLEKVRDALIGLGYEREDMVEGRGQFAVRGGIIDIFPLTTVHPVRIEFWGDEVDSIRLFDENTQRSIEPLEKISVFPVEEFLIDHSKLEAIGDKILKDNPGLTAEVETIKNGNYLMKLDRFFSYFYEKTSTLFDYISKDTIIFVDEPARIKSKCQAIEFENKEIIEQFLEKNKYIPGYVNEMSTFVQIITELEAKNIIYLERMDTNMTARRNGYSFHCREVNFFRSSVDIFLEEVQKEYGSGKKIIILAGTNSKARSIATMLLEHNINAEFVEKEKLEITDDKQILITSGNLSEGFEYVELNLVVVAGESNVVKEKKRTYKPTAFTEGQKVVFADLKVGDYVVHATHGIGQYVGINTLIVDDKKKDYIKIKYRDEDILYIPTNQLEMIRKYIGSGDAAPKLNRLGSKEFAKTKAKVKESLKDIAKGLIELYANRQKQVGYQFSKDTVWQTQFEEQFPYQETEDQLRCIEEVKTDMESTRPMDRLLCGDVGYGKTEVAIRAAFKAVMDGKQVAYLVPTTVLSQQQYTTFAERMAGYPVKVAVLNRFKTKKEQTKILEALKNGEVDIVIGTHRIVQKDIQFKDLGLLIIDEEQRFGVEHKELIKKMKANVDVLTMTATPIPRTLHMSIVGIRDMSVIYEPPHNRRPVQTYVLEYDEEVIREAILKELERGGQIFYLFNRVEGIERKASELQKLVPEARISYAHGKMTGRELENMMADFIEKKIDLLLCTTILESGIDIPNANTIIIEDADRLGLAQLYQIRGRVGRSDKAAYAYITYRKNKLLAEASEKRLKAIKEFTEFGSGFKIALRDLEIRGAGNILGPEQHGHMEAVGYEMYCKLLDESVKEMQGEKVQEDFETQIDLKVSAYLPDDYIANSSQKIEVYQDIANISKEEQISEIVDELIDRYGEMPDEVVSLLEVARIKVFAKELWITSIKQKGDKVVITLKNNEAFDTDKVPILINEYQNKLYFSAGALPYFTLKLQSEKESDILKEVLKLLKIMKG